MFTIQGMAGDYHPVKLIPTSARKVVEVEDVVTSLAEILKLYQIS